MPMRVSLASCSILLLAGLALAAPRLPNEIATRPWLGLDGGGLTVDVGVSSIKQPDASAHLFASWNSFGFGLFRDADLLGWRFSAAGLLDDGLSFGASLRILSAAGWTDLAADFGLSWAFGPSIMAELAAQTVVLSRNAGGRLSPGYRLGFVFGAEHDWFSFEPWVRLLVGHDSLEAGVSLVCLPLSGLRVEAGWKYEAQEHVVSAGIGIGFGSILTRFSGEHRPAQTRAGLSLVVGDHGTGDLTGDPVFCLEISVAGEMAETGKDGNALIGVPSVIGFARQISAIRKAALDPRVRAAIVHLRAHSLGWARSEEMMQALLELRARKIPLIACVESADLRSLMIASAADEIHVHESAQVRTSGPAMLATFYTGLLEKLGLEARLLYRSEYKTAAQSVTEKSMTVAHRESAQRVVDLITSRALALIATNRGVPLTRVLGWSRDGLMTPREAVKKGLVTGTLSWDGVRRFIAGKGFRLARPEAWLGVQSGFSRPSGIAIVHVEGTIVNGGGGLPQLPFGETSAGADTVVRALSRATSDRSIRGIIVRVQSGGGDVLASERMRAAIVAAAQRKPLVISMADLAASGGYYLACGDGKTPIMVFAKSATLTGSIGVITGKLVTRKLRGTLGLASESVGDSNARIYGDETDFTPNQLALVTKMLDYWYDEFKSAVARGRRMQRERVEQYARGRVWAGMDAIEFGLIDREGGFHAALLWLADRINKPWQDLDLIEINSQPANLSRLVTGGISLDLSAIMDNDAWPGLFFSGRALALLPWKLQLE